MALRVDVSDTGKGKRFNLKGDHHWTEVSVRDLVKRDSAYFDQAHANIVFSVLQG